MYPSGVAIRTNSGKRYLAKNGYMIRIDSDKVWDSWNFGRIVTVHDDAVKDVPVAGRLGFRDGTIVRDFGSRKIYLVSDQKIRHINDPVALEKLRVSLRDIVVVSTEEIKTLREGEPIGRF